jgi:hypothetical protein
MQLNDWLPEVATQFFLLGRKSQIREFSRKIAVFLVQNRINLPLLLLLSYYVIFWTTKYHVTPKSQKSSLNSNERQHVKVTNEKGEASGAVLTIIC